MIHHTTDHYYKKQKENATITSKEQAKATATNTGLFLHWRVDRKKSGTQGQQLNHGLSKKKKKGGYIQYF